MFKTPRLSRVHDDDPIWPRPVDPRHFTAVQFEPAVKHAAEVATRNAEVRRIACMAQPPPRQVAPTSGGVAAVMDLFVGVA